MTYWSYRGWYSSQKKAKSTKVETKSFTAFTLDALQDAGVDGHLDYGDGFTMPASASVDLNVRDNDKKLAGDTRYNDQANDTEQQAKILDEDGQEVGNGGQVYLEREIELRGSDGKTYTMVEIEQEGSNAKFYSFVGKVPAAGVKLSVKCSDYCAKGVKYDKLGAGDIVPEEPPGR